LDRHIELQDSRSIPDPRIVDTGERPVWCVPRNGTDKKAHILAGWRPKVKHTLAADRKGLCGRPLGLHGRIPTHPPEAGLKPCPIGVH